MSALSRMVSESLREALPPCVHAGARVATISRAADRERGGIEISRPALGAVDPTKVHREMQAAMVDNARTRSALKTGDNVTQGTGLTRERRRQSSRCIIRARRTRRPFSWLEERRTRPMRRTLWMVVALAALVTAPPVWAQRTTGNITGVVKDTTGAALPGVTVGVTGPNIVGTQTSVTNESGIYRLANLPPGDYQLSFALSGFKGLRKSIHVSVGSMIEENAALEVGQLSENIDVVGEAPVVDTKSNEVGSNFDRDWIANAPLRRFSFFDLVASAPGSLPGGDSNNTSRHMVLGCAS